MRNGRRLHDLVAEATTEVEGIGLGFLLNPVSVEEIECWASWNGTAFAVHRPTYPARSYFEFELFHRPHFLDVLWSIREHGAALRNANEAARVRTYHELVGIRGLDALERLVDFFWQSERYGAALRKNGKPCVDSLDEAQRVMNDVGAVPADPAALAPFISMLLELSQRRFAISSSGSPIPRV